MKLCKVSPKLFIRTNISFLVRISKCIVQYVFMQPGLVLRIISSLNKAKLHDRTNCLNKRLSPQNLIFFGKSCFCLNQSSNSRPKVELGALDISQFSRGILEKSSQQQQQLGFDLWPKCFCHTTDFPVYLRSVAFGDSQKIRLMPNIRLTKVNKWGKDRN